MERNKETWRKEEWLSKSLYEEKQVLNNAVRWHTHAHVDGKNGLARIEKSN